MIAGAVGITGTGGLVQLDCPADFDGIEDIGTLQVGQYYPVVFSPKSICRHMSLLSCGKVYNLISLFVFIKLTQV